MYFVFLKYVKFVNIKLRNYNDDLLLIKRYIQNLLQYVEVERIILNICSHICIMCCPFHYKFYIKHTKFENETAC